MAQVGLKWAQVGPYGLGPYGPGLARKQKLADWLAKAREAKSASRWGDTIRAYKEAYKLRPSPLYIKEMGHAYRKKGQTGNACKQYKKYLSRLKGDRRMDAKGALAVFGCDL